MVTIPPIEKKPYFGIQLIDLYSFNFNYIGSRTTGNGGGSYLIVGPHWKGQLPKGITKIIHTETEITLLVYRTQLFNPGDIENVKKNQSQYKLQKLSAFLGKPAPKAAPAINFITPLTPAAQIHSLQFYNVLNFVLKYCPTHPSEKALMVRFAKINVGAGKTLDTTKLSPEIKAAIKDEMADAWLEFENLKKTEFETGKVTSGDVFGTREHLKNNYLYRMAAAVVGIYGNSAAEAMYPVYALDANKHPLSGANNYTIHFNKGELPPVNSFWSLTMYELPSILLTPNPIKRYLINSPMLPQFKFDADGGLTLYIQHDSPGADKESNWLPAPAGPFTIYMRLYWPKNEALQGQWKQPPMVRS